MQFQSRTHLLLLFSTLFVVGFYLQGCASKDEKPSPPQSDSSPNRNDRLPGQSSNDFPHDLGDQNDPFDTVGTNVNSLEGWWKISFFESFRSDEPVTFLKSLLQDKASLTLKVRDVGTGDGHTANSTLEIDSNPVSGNTTCKVSLDFDSTYCCSSMLTFILNLVGTPAREHPAGCSLLAFGTDVNEVARKITSAIADSTVPFAPSVYFFSYSFSNTRIRLRTPPPEDKAKPLPPLLTEIQFIKTQ